MGITNTRLSATKRGIAAELALQVAARLDRPVCLVGADPTDRDVERRMPRLAASEGGYERMTLDNGPHRLEAMLLARQRLGIVTLSDRVVVDAVLPRLREIFEIVIIDAPSRVGSGVGIARMLLPHLDALVIASGLHAGDIALTRVYVDALGRMPGAARVDVRVVASGGADDTGLAPDQLQRRLVGLPMAGRIPRLWADPAKERAQTPEQLGRAFRTLVEMILEHHDARRPEPAPRPRRALGHPTPGRVGS